MKPHVYAALSFLVLLTLSSIVHADQWVPYTDGRAGGCWINDQTHQMWGCTIEPAALPPREAAPPDTDVNGAMRNLLDSARSSKSPRHGDPTLAPETTYVPETSTYGITSSSAQDRAAAVANDNGRANSATYELTKSLNAPLSECAKRGKTATCDNSGCSCR